MQAVIWPSTAMHSHVLLQYLSNYSRAFPPGIIFELKKKPIKVNTKPKWILHKKAMITYDIETYHWDTNDNTPMIT